MRVVLDTNVIISGLNFPGNERAVLNLARRGRFQLCLSSFILAEVESVLTRKFDWESARVTQALAMLRAVAIVIKPPRVTSAVEEHEADNRVLDCVVEASAAWLVTGDRHHLLPLGEHGGATIVNAPRFLSEVEAEGPDFQRD